MSSVGAPEHGGDSGAAGGTTRELVVGLLVVLATVALVLGVLAGLLSLVGFFACGCTRVPVPS